MSAAEMQAAITRLEAVAVRLESLAQTTGTTTSGGGGSGGSGAAAPGNICFMFYNMNYYKLLHIHYVESN